MRLPARYSPPIGCCWDRAWVGRFGRFAAGRDILVLFSRWRRGVWFADPPQPGREAGVRPDHVGAVAPARAPALMALNTSAIYLGQAAGGASGGWLIAHRGYGVLSYAGLAWLALAIALSVWATRAVVRATR